MKVDPHRRPLHIGGLTIVLVAGLFLSIDAIVPWLGADPRASDGAALAAAAMAEVCTTPAVLPRRQPFPARALRDPFARR